MNTREYAAQLRNSLFATRDNIVDAYKYVEQVANASDNPAAVYTAVHVLMNTISKELVELVADTEETV